MIAYMEIHDLMIAYMAIHDFNTVTFNHCFSDLPSEYFSLLCIDFKYWNQGAGIYQWGGVPRLSLFLFKTVIGCVTALGPGEF